MTIREVKPLQLTVDRWLTDTDEEANLAFGTTPGLQHAEIGIAWGPGPRQSRVYALQEPDLEAIYDWARKALGYDDD